MSLQAPLWRSIAVFRFASLAYAAVVLVIRHQYYVYWGWAWAVIAAMAAWTVVSTIAYASPARRTWPLLGADLVVTVLALLSTGILQTASAAHAGVMPITATWLAGPALAWAVVGGARAGAVAAVVIGGGAVWLRHEPVGGIYQSTALDGPVIVLIAAMLVGYVSTLATRAEQALQRATEIEAASRERERLARTMHDSVLQVLAMVQRRGAEAGGEAAEIGRLAGEQGAALRALVTGDGPAAPASGQLDLSARLSRYLATLATRAEQALQRATEIEAASWERERLARTIQDSVLQVLAMVQRRAAEAGGEAAEIGRLAGEQGAALRALVTGDGPASPASGLGLGIGDHPRRSRAPHRAGRRGNGGSGSRCDRQRAAALWRDRQGVGPGRRRGPGRQRDRTRRRTRDPPGAAGRGRGRGPAGGQSRDHRADPRPGRFGGHQQHSGRGYRGPAAGAQGRTGTLGRGSDRRRRKT
jgi:signal transduction histidine kinase